MHQQLIVTSASVEVFVVFSRSNVEHTSHYEPVHAAVDEASDARRGDAAQEPNAAQEKELQRRKDAALRQAALQEEEELRRRKRAIDRSHRSKEGIVRAAADAVIGKNEETVEEHSQRLQLAAQQRERKSQRARGGASDEAESAAAERADESVAGTLANETGAAAAGPARGPTTRGGSRRTGRRTAAAAAVAAAAEPVNDYARQCVEVENSDEQLSRGQDAPLQSPSSSRRAASTLMSVRVHQVYVPRARGREREHAPWSTLRSESANLAQAQAHGRRLVAAIPPESRGTRSCARLP